MTHARVRPARHVNYSTDLMTNVRGVHGHSGYCACGWTGLIWRTHGEAQSEARWHNYVVHGDGKAALEREEAKATESAEPS